MLMRRNFRNKKKGPVNAKKIEYDGIKFASGLEKYMYVALKTAKIKAEYEGEVYMTVPGFYLKNNCYERQANSKGSFVNRGKKKIQPIKYTPDFVGKDFIIECKGRPNESFPIRWKLFKNFISTNSPEIDIYKPQNQKECDEVVKIILNKKRKSIYGKNKK
jgi:hypothetical protein